MTWATDALADRHVLVTGGSRGIGAACCRLFAAAGARVAVHYHRAEDAARTVVAGLADCGREHLAVGADLGTAAGVKELFAEVDRRWRGLDVLVNNAGIWVRNPLAELDAAKLSETLAVNLSGPILCAAEGLELLRHSPRDPSIVNISSTAGQRGEAHYSPYAASKGALISLTKSWAVELAPEIRVNSVAPGWVDTDMSEPAYRDGGRDAIAAGIPLRRIATAEDIAGAVLFLASAAARHVTGEILNVNGGAVLCG